MFSAHDVIVVSLYYLLTVERQPKDKCHLNQIAIARYGILNSLLLFQASVDDINNAFRRLSKIYHPDKHVKSPERAQDAQTQFTKLKKAHEGKTYGSVFMNVKLFLFWCRPDICRFQFTCTVYYFRTLQREICAHIFSCTYSFVRSTYESYI